jgi:hypothetical protein
MTVGEKAVLTCRSDYAYGQRGYLPTTPAGATLLFDVELLSFPGSDAVHGDFSVQLACVVSIAAAIRSA